jgi:hypothetical protein
MGRAKESSRGRQVSRLAQTHVHHLAVAVDGALQVTPSAIDLDISLVDVSALANDASASLAQLRRNYRSELRLPVPYRLVGEHEATFEEHLGEFP